MTHGHAQGKSDDRPWVNPRPPPLQQFLQQNGPLQQLYSPHALSQSPIFSTASTASTASTGTALQHFYSIQPLHHPSGKPPMPAAQPSSARAATLFASMQARIDCHTRMKLARYATPTGRSSADGKRCRQQSQVCSLLPIAPPLWLSARNQLQAHRPFVAFLSVVAVRSVTRRSNHVFDRELHDRRRVAHLSLSEPYGGEIHIQ